MRPYVNLLVGDPAPWFTQRSPSNPRYAFDTAAGRYIVLRFYASAGDARGQAALKTVVAGRAMFDDQRACFFGVSLDKADESMGRVKDTFPGLRFIWDFNAAVSKLYGVVPKDADPETEKNLPLRRLWVVLDPTLRIIKIVPFAKDGSCAAEVLAFVES